MQLQLASRAAPQKIHRILHIPHHPPSNDLYDDCQGVHFNGRHCRELRVRIIDRRCMQVCSNLCYMADIRNNHKHEDQPKTIEPDLQVHTIGLY